MAVRIDVNRQGIAAPRTGGVEVRGPGSGEAVAAIGRTLSDFAQPQLQQHIRERAAQEEMANRIEAARRTSEIRLEWQQKLREELDKYDGSAPGFAEGFSRQYADNVRERIAGMPEPIRKSVEIDLISFGERLTSSALEGEGGKRDAWTMKGLTSTLDAEAMALLDRPDDLPGALESMAGLAEGAPPALRGKFLEDSRRVLTASYAEAMLRDNPEGLLVELTDGQLDGVLNADQKGRYMKAAQGEVDKIVAEAERAAAAEFRRRQKTATDLVARVVAYYNAGLAPPPDLYAAAQDAALAIEDGGSLEKMKLAEYRARRQRSSGGGTPDSFKAIEKGLALGLEPSPDLVAQAVAEVEADPTGKLGPMLEKIAATAAIRQGAALMPRVDLEARIAELRGAPAGAAEIAELDVLTKVKKARDARAADDNLGWVMANGVQIAPVSLSSPDLVTNIAVRARDARLVAEETGEKVQMFTKAERAELGKALEAMPPDKQVETLAQLNAGAGSEAGTVMRELAAKSPVFAQAGHLAATGRAEIARLALVGRAALKANPQLLPKSKAALTAVETEVLGPLYGLAPPEVKQSIIDLARGIYAEQAQRAGKTGEDFSESDYRAALQMAAGRQGREGGTGKVRKQMVHLPPHMSAGTVESLINRMTAEEWTAYAYGTPGTPVDESGAALTPEQLRRAHLVSVGEGLYQIKLVDPRLGRGAYVLAAPLDSREVKGGALKPYVLDLRSVVPQVVDQRKGMTTPPRAPDRKDPYSEATRSETYQRALDKQAEKDKGRYQLPYGQAPKKDED